MEQALLRLFAFPLESCEKKANALFELVPRHPIVSPHRQRISRGLSNAASAFIFIPYSGDFLSGRFRANIWYCGPRVRGWGGGAPPRREAIRRLHAEQEGRRRRGRGQAGRAGKRRKCAREAERWCESRTRHKSFAGAKIIENGSPRGRLNQAAASSVCSVIAGSADQVVLEAAVRRPEEKQAGMWSELDRGGEGKGTGLVVPAGRVRVRAVVA